MMLLNKLLEGQTYISNIKALGLVVSDKKILPSSLSVFCLFIVISAVDNVTQ